MRFLRFIIITLLLAGCKPAARYGAVKVAKGEDTGSSKREMVLPIYYSWLHTQPMLDTPLRFVSTATKEWAVLIKFWNLEATWIPVLALGLPPLPAASTLIAALPQLEIKIKVP